MTKKLRNEDLSFIESLIELLKKNDLTNLEISRDEGDDRGISIRLSQQSNIDLPFENVNTRKNKCENMFLVPNVGWAWALPRPYLLLLLWPYCCYVFLLEFVYE